MLNPNITLTNFNSTICFLNFETKTACHLPLALVCWVLMTACLQGVNDSLKKDLFSTGWHVIKRYICLHLGCVLTVKYIEIFLPGDIQHTEISKNLCQRLNSLVGYLGRGFWYYCLFVLFLIGCHINCFARITLFIVLSKHFHQMLKVD